MTKTVDFYFDFASPNAYLSHQVVSGIEERTGTKFNYIPVLLGGIFKATNNKPPMEAFFGILNKNEYQSVEMKRFQERYGIDKFKVFNRTGMHNPNYSTDGHMEWIVDLQENVQWVVMPKVVKREPYVWDKSMQLVPY